MLFIVAGAALGAHYLVSSTIDADTYWSQTDYSLFGLYAFGAVASMIVMSLIIGINYAMPEKLGFIFLAIITLKAVASYIYIKDGLNRFENNFIELNFLVMFFIFLFFDVYIAFSTLNQDKVKE